MGSEAIAAYRALLRARRKCLAGDTPMLVESLRRVRTSFDSNRHVSDPTQIQQLLSDAREAVNNFNHLVVQARLNERANYEPIVEPGRNSREWDRSDPHYTAMVQQLVGRVVPSPAGKQETGEAVVAAQRPLPVNRHITAGRGSDEDVPVAPGTLNIAHVRQIFLQYHGLAKGQEKPMDVKSLAEKYKVDIVLLEKVLHYNELLDKKKVSADLSNKGGSKSSED